MEPMTVLMIVVVILFVLLIVITSAVKIVQQYELGVVLRFGRLVGTKKPGIRIIIPFIDRMRKIDTRVVTIDVPSQEVITRDNVTARVNAVVFLRVMDPEKAAVEVFDFRVATYQMSQTTLRSVLGQHELDELLSQREMVNEMLRGIIDDATDPWGIKVTSVEIKDVELPSGMQRAMAAQAEAERDRRAKIILAEGELQASVKLAQAGEIIAREPTTLQLRYLQTLHMIASEKTNTVIFPLPMDILRAFMSDRAKRGEE
ncbi:slipin family protein [Dehalococcoidia bacterium]|nr:slipin family protein [Dehalococcoidia bacterium]MCL0073817.1 slipin family protein [Dehalococcoidia bacterium]MCL0075328.1 slipin family protein [Dehalococcoidia bacterium]MCL0088294.1 slipin family protein [Dehalococcoidia bacterium]